MKRKIVATLAMLLVAGLCFADGIDYVNHVKATATGVVRFHLSQSGAAAGGSTSRPVDWVNIFNGTADDLTLLVYFSEGPFTTDVLTCYVDSLETDRDIFVPGRIDSINIAVAPGIGAGTPVLFWAYDGEPAH